jgi:hypothetical protein
MMMTSHCVPFGTYWADRPLGRYGESDQTNVGRRVGKLCQEFVQVSGLETGKLGAGTLCVCGCWVKPAAPTNQPASQPAFFNIFFKFLK